MDATSKRLLITGLIVLLVIPLMSAAQPAAAAPPGQGADPYTVINMVNALRAEYGLPPYQVNAQLMAAAQAHSQWAASVGTHSHTGLGGSTPTDRALAAGYGGGQSVRVSENIYWGTNATAQSALQWWRNSPIHFRGMTSTQYVEIGAGVAYGSGGGYFTLKFGVVLTGGNNGQGAAPQAVQPAPGARPLPVYVFEPVEVAEPREDGSVVHVVGEGQNLSYIAEAYEVAVSEIMALNRLTEDSLIHPGNELIIVPAPVQPVEEVEGPIIHTVEAGQTLFGIALSYGKTLDEVLVLNGLTENSVIHPGNQLIIQPDPNATPVPRQPLYHIVQEGQTLHAIALRYGTDLKTLLELNSMAETDIIRPGDELLIRPGDPTPVPEPTATIPVPTTPPTVERPTPDPRATEVAQMAQAATLAPTLTAAAEAQPSDASEPAQQGFKPGRGLLIGAVVLVGLAGGGLVIAGIVMKPK